MADIVDPHKRSEMMSGIRAKNTKPEILVRQLLHRLGYRFRLHCKDLPGKPDIVLPRWKTVIFVHGCFWHGHDDCPLFRLPKSRTEFWETKIAKNKCRDAEVRMQLEASGWKTITVWECAIKGKSKLQPNAFEAAVSTSLKNPNSTLFEIRG